MFSRLRLFRLLLCCAVLCNSALFLHAAGKRVIMISIDGLRGPTLASIAGRHLDTPNLDEFVQGGAVADGMVGVFPTVTYPSHTTLVTGVSPDVHGILGNGLFDPTHEMRGAWYWYADQIKAPTLWDLAHSRGLTTAAVAWPVTVGARIDANFPEYRMTRTLDDQLAYRAMCTPGLYAEYEKSSQRSGSRSDEPEEVAIDREVTDRAIFLLRTRKPALLLVHLGETDHQEHLHGPDSKEMFEALQRIDKHIGEIRAAVREAGLADQTVFVICSDHGFWPVNQGFNPNAVLNSLGLLGSTAAPMGQDRPARSDASDPWRVSAFIAGGAFGLVARDPNDHEAIALAEKTIRSLASDEHWGIDQVFEGSTLQGMHGFSNSFMAVSMKRGYTVSGASSGPWLRPTHNLLGMHGFAPGPTELDSSFVAFGPGIKAQHLGRKEIVDVAPTVSAILGIPMEKAEGVNLLPNE